MHTRWLFVAATLASSGVVVWGCGSDGTGVDPGPDAGDRADATTEGGTSDAGAADGAGNDAARDAAGDASGDAAVTCRLNGQSCNGTGQCCSASCNPTTNVCDNPIGTCKVAGAGCGSANECCTFVCAGGACGSTQCISDNRACTSNAQCCGGRCAAGDGGATTCQPLNTTCHTAGNACTAHAECCSAFCNNGLCGGQPSFCTQSGDTCTTNLECCTGACTVATGASLGTCAAQTAIGGGGTSQCKIAGQLCGAGAAADGGAIQDGGVPSCGGECCSRSCAPYGSTGVLSCQPPSGCRPTGEICRADADCCGFGGVQGSTGVGSCSKASPGDAVGRCDNGNACRPAGAICKLGGGSCNAENNCCTGPVTGSNPNPSWLNCQQDLLGIPRCTMAAINCADAGTQAGRACATSADCCGLPCVPNPAFTGDAGTSPFVCGTTCVPQGNSCTSNADCCRGLPCVIPPGGSTGACGGGLQPDGGSDAGATDAGSTDAGAQQPDAQVCGLYGQQCTQGSDCCSNVPCTRGACVYDVPR